MIQHVGFLGRQAVSCTALLSTWAAISCIYKKHVDGYDTEVHKYRDYVMIKMAASFQCTYVIETIIGVDRKHHGRGFEVCFATSKSVTMLIV